MLFPVLPVRSPGRGGPALWIAYSWPLEVSTDSLHVLCGGCGATLASYWFKAVVCSAG